MARIETVVALTGVWSYEAPSYGAPWKTETRYIYKMTDLSDGRVFVWRTTKGIGKEERVPGLKCANFIDKDGCPLVWHNANKGDVIRIKATEGESGTYKGEVEVAISRVKVVEWISAVETPEEKAARAAAERAAAKKALLESISDGDEIIRMDYSRYKAHYADCETVPDSFKAPESPLVYARPTIEVVVRAGRMKNSGTRGKSFRTWIMDCVIDGSPARKYVYAICPENAEKRLRKDYPGVTDIECVGAARESAMWID